MKVRKGNNLFVKERKFSGSFLNVFFLAGWGGLGVAL